MKNIKENKDSRCEASSLSLSLSLSGALIGISLLSGVILASSTTSADVVDDVTITVPVSCNMTSELDEAHTATINPGQYQSDIGITNFTVFCNDNSGYAIYAIGYSNEEYGNTKMLATIGNQLAPTYDINTGTATSGNTSNWAMKLIPVTTASSGTTQPYTPTIENGFESYHIVPSEYTKVATFASNTDFTIGSSLQSTYQVYIDGTKPAGTYAGKVKYTLVHPASHGAPAILNPNADDISEVNYMQDFAVVSNENRNAIIASMVPEQQYTLTDSRDNKTYTIAKYQAGTDSETNQPIYDVWMTKNLDLDIDTGVTYTNEDTDLGYNTTTNSYDSASWTPTRSTYQATATHIHEWCQGGTWNSQYSYCENNETPESYNPGNLYWNLTESDYSDWNEYYSSCDYSTSTPTCDQSKNPISTYVSSTGTEQYHLGNYYNWAAALATNDSSAFNNDALVEQSICPAGWTLPRVGTDEDTFYSLWNQYGFGSSSISGSNKLWTSPLYFAAGGSFYGNLGGVGVGGGFWAPAPYGSDSARYAYFLVDGVAGPSDGLHRGYGYSVRCILRPVVDSVSDSGGGGAM